MPVAVTESEPVFDPSQVQIPPLNLQQPLSPEDNCYTYLRYYGINFAESITGVEHFFGQVSFQQFAIASHYYRHPESRATVFILHGYYDHSGLYRHIIEFCLRQHYSVVIYDLPGHGLSTGARASITAFSQYQQLLRQMLQTFQPHITQPIFAMGQSTGGAVLMEYLLTAEPCVIDKAVLLAPLFRPARWPLATVLYRLAKPFLRRVRRGRMVNSGDVDFNEFLDHRDPLQEWSLPVDWVTAMMQWIAYFQTLPVSRQTVLLIQGDADRTVDWCHNLQEIRRHFPAMQLQMLHGAQHHLANETAAYRQQYLATVAAYLQDSSV